MCALGGNAFLQIYFTSQMAVALTLAYGFIFPSPNIRLAQEHWEKPVS